MRYPTIRTLHRRSSSSPTLKGLPRTKTSPITHSLREGGRTWCYERYMDWSQWQCSDVGEDPVQSPVDDTKLWRNDMWVTVQIPEQSANLRGNILKKSQRWHHMEWCQLLVLGLLPSHAADQGSIPWGRMPKPFPIFCPFMFLTCSARFFLSTGPWIAMCSNLFNPLLSVHWPVNCFIIPWNSFVWFLITF